MKLTVLLPVDVEIGDRDLLPAAEYARLLDGRGQGDTVDTHSVIEAAAAQGTLLLAADPRAKLRMRGRRVRGLPEGWCVDAAHDFYWTDEQLGEAVEADSVPEYLASLEPADPDEDEDDEA